MCHTCDNFRQAIANAKAEGNAQKERIMLALLERHKATTCTDNALYRQLWAHAEVRG